MNCEEHIRISEKRQVGMTITQLSTFIQIAEFKSFSAAANSLGYAQSTVTTQIKQLEDELGCDFPIYSQVLIHKDKHQNKAINSLVERIRALG